MTVEQRAQRTAEIDARSRALPPTVSSYHISLTYPLTLSSHAILLPYPLSLTPLLFYAESAILLRRVRYPPPRVSAILLRGRYAVSAILLPFPPTLSSYPILLRSLRYPPRVGDAARGGSPGSGGGGRGRRQRGERLTRSCCGGGGR